MMLGVEVSGAPYGGVVFEPGAAASVAIMAGLLAWFMARRFGVPAAAVVVVALALVGMHSGDATLDGLYVNTPAAEVATNLPDDEVIDELFVDISRLSPNLSNALAWEVAFDRTVLEVTSVTTHLLTATDTEPPQDGVMVAEFAGGTLWRVR